MKKTKSRPEYYWTINSPYSGFLHESLCNDKKYCIHKFTTNRDRSWQEFKWDGYRCVLVRISEVKK